MLPMGFMRWLHVWLHFVQRLVRAPRREMFRLAAKQLAISYGRAYLSWKLLALIPLRTKMKRVHLFMWFMQQQYFGDELERWKMRLLGWESAAL